MKTHIQNKIIYHIYPKSFQDSNDDGIGDLNGIRSRLDYLSWLGVDLIWLGPVYRSPGFDNGYDISDYYDIDPIFGTRADMTSLLKDAKARQIGVMMDIVANHTSHTHEWFKASELDPSGPYGEYYIWRDKPNAMNSFFGGSAWTYSPIRKQYYFHSFAPEQPDLNWEQEQMGKELAEVLSYWVKQGVKGFRFDVIDLIGKNVDTLEWFCFDKVKAGLKTLLSRVDSSGLVLVGEAGALNAGQIIELQQSSLLDMVFNFEVTALDEQTGRGKWELAPFSTRRFKDALVSWQERLQNGGWNSLFWNNHDQPRAISRWYADSLEAAAMLAVLQFGLRGTPFIYQGDEIGMTNGLIQLEDYKDIETLNYLKTSDNLEGVRMKGRDHARIPMAWTSGSSGFSKSEPWLRAVKIESGRTVENQQQDKSSLLFLYRQLIGLRKTYPVLMKGQFCVMETKEHLLCFQRTDPTERAVTVLVNLTDQEVKHPFEIERLLCATHEQPSSVLRPYEAVICYTF